MNNRIRVMILLPEGDQIYGRNILHQHLTVYFLDYNRIYFYYTIAVYRKSGYGCYYEMHRDISAANLEINSDCTIL